MQVEIKCEICGVKIGVEGHGEQLHNYFYRPGRYYFCTTELFYNAANQEYCKECYQKIEVQKNGN